MFIKPLTLPTLVYAGIMNGVQIEDYDQSDNGVRLASKEYKMVRQAAREGLSSLYEDAEEVLKRYRGRHKDDDGFDIVQAMLDRRGENVLWVRARAIDADTVNANGDYFSKAELLKESEVKIKDENGKTSTKKIPAYKTFEGVPIHRNHENQDITKAMGMVVYAEWDEEENCVYCTFIIDAESYPEVARGIRVGYMKDVSMGCQVQSGVCSVKGCENEAVTEKDYCEHLRKWKGKYHPQLKQRIYEKNKGIKFIELSVVGDGAFETCEIEVLINPEEVIEKALSADRKADSLGTLILRESYKLPESQESKDFIRESLAFVAKIKEVTACAAGDLRLAQSHGQRLAQVAGTLVGGQIMAAEGAEQNSTVANILQYLGIDPRSGLNVLDLLNLALNFLEVAVLNLFARKDNVDLSHVSKITKAMGDLQSTMQDVIDDGIDTGGSGGGVPLNQGNLQQGQAPAQGAGDPSQVAEQSYSPAGGIGRMMGPQLPPFGANNQGGLAGHLGFGGGVVASTTAGGRMILWGDESENLTREVTASTKSEQGNTALKNPSIARFGDSVRSFGETIGVNTGNLQPQRSASSENTNIRKNSPAAKPNNEVIQTAKTMGDNKMSNRIWEKLASVSRADNAAIATEKMELQDKAGNKVVVSSRGNGIEAYHNDKLVDVYKLDMTQADRVANGQGLDVMSEVLSEFGKRVAAAKSSTRVANWEPNHDTTTVMEERLEKLRANQERDITERELDESLAGDYKRIDAKGDKIREELLEEVRQGTPELGEIREVRLESEEAGLYGRKNPKADKIREELLEELRLGHPDTTIEEQLERVRKTYTASEPSLVATATVSSLAKAVVASRVHPEEVIEAAGRLAERSNLGELILLAALGTPIREKLAKREAFHRTAGIATSAQIERSIVNALGDALNENKLAPSRLASALAVFSRGGEKAVETIAIAAKTDMGEEQFVASTSKRTASYEDQLEAAFNAQAEGTNVTASAIGGKEFRAATNAMISCVNDLQVAPREVLSALRDMTADELSMAIELARVPAEVETRIINRERIAFFGGRKVSASKQDVTSGIVGWLADYSVANEIPTRAIVAACAKHCEQPVASQRIITKLVQKINSREANVQITDEETTTKRIVATATEIGVSQDDPNFREALRSKAIEMLSGKGWEVDPNTFQFTSVTVGAGGDITAEVTSRFSRTTDGAVASALPGEIPGADPIGSPIEMEPAPESNPMPGEVETIVSAGAQQAMMERKAQRQKLMRLAQGMPGMDAMGAGMGMGGGMGAGAAAPGADGLGFSALTVPTAAGDAPVDDPANSDAMAEPGNDKLPFGSVCPQCGSKNTDNNNGDVSCNDCPAKWKISYKLEMAPPGDDNSGNEEAEGAADPMAGLGADAGLGAATAPAPAGGAPAPGGAPVGGAPMAPTAANARVVMRLAYRTTPDVWVHASQSQNESERLAHKLQPVGVICPGCGCRGEGVSRVASTNGNGYTFCYHCNETFPYEIRHSKRAGTIIASIKKLV